MSEFLDRIRAAENDIKNANKHLKAVEKEKENKLKNMEKGLQALAADKETLALKLTSPSFSYEDLDVYLDYINYRGQVYPLEFTMTVNCF